MGSVQILIRFHPVSFAVETWRSVICWFITLGDWFLRIFYDIGGKTSHVSSRLFLDSDLSVNVLKLRNLDFIQKMIDYFKITYKMIKKNEFTQCFVQSFTALMDTYALYYSYLHIKCDINT